MKVFVVGSSGFMGKMCVNFLVEKGFTVVSDRVDVTDSCALNNMFTKHKPDVVINFAGVRAYPTIDWCEDNKEETIKVNVMGPLNVAFAAIAVEAYMIQVASGCIYEGGSDYEFTEEDVPNFTRSFYSRMRIAMQSLLKELPVLQVRIRMPVSSSYHARNLITKITSYSKVISEPNSVTVLEDMFEAFLVLIEKRPTGILNLTNDGYVTNVEVLEAYKKIVDPSIVYTVISPQELELGVTKTGRSNCVLSNSKRNILGIEMRALNGERLESLLLSYKNSLG